MARVYRSTLRAGRSLLGSLYRTFADYGRLVVCHGVDPAAAARSAPRRGTPPGHPERLCPEISLSAAEAALARQLRDIALPVRGQR